MIRAKIRAERGIFAGLLRPRRWMVTFYRDGVPMPEMPVVPVPTHREAIEWATRVVRNSNSTRVPPPRAMVIRGEQLLRIGW